MQPAAKLRDVVDQELKHVSFAFDNIDFGSLIVCGLLALPHGLVYFRHFGHRVPTTMKFFSPVVSRTENVSLVMVSATSWYTAEFCSTTLAVAY